MYKCVLNSVVKISVMFAKYFEYYTITPRGPFFCGHAVDVKRFYFFIHGTFFTFVNVFLFLRRFSF